MKLPVCAVILLLAALCGPAGAGQQVHGEGDRFAGHGIAMAWAILKAAVEDESRVVVRMAPLDPRLVAASIEGVDPFTDRREQVLARTALGAALDATSRRGTFADLPRREFHFYTAAGEKTAPAVTVYFLGTPDTTPEFLAEEALRAYLDATLAALRRPRPGP
jgi:hypothetical protein